MTPERIEEIKKAIPEAEKFIEQNKIFIQLGLDGFTDEVFSDMRYLLAALEEAQQQAAEWEKNARTEYRINNEVQDELRVAQQTIARQREALDKIEEEMTFDTTSRAMRINAIIGAAIRNKEGEKTESHSCGEGGECRCIDCGGIESRTWVCEACQKKREAQDRL